MKSWRFVLVIGVCVGGVVGAGLCARVSSAQETSSAPKGELRTWKTKDGDFSTEAAFLERKGDNVVLERKDGKVITVPLAKLSFDDRVYVSELAKKAAAAKAPPPAKTPAKTPAKKPAPGEKTPAAGAGAGASSEVAAILKSWDQPYDPLQMTSLAQWKLETQPDQFELTADGEFVYAAFYKSARHELYRTKDGKLLHTINYGEAPLTAAAISPDGKHLVATLGEKGCGVYDIAAQKEVYLHERIKEVNLMQVTRGKKQYLVATQPTGSLFRFPLLGGPGTETIVPPTIKLLPDAKAWFASSSDETHMILSFPQRIGGHSQLSFDEDGKVIEQKHIKTNATNNAPFGMGRRLYGFAFVQGQLTWALVSDHDPPPGLTYPYGWRIVPQIFVSPDDRYSAIYQPERGRIEFEHVASRGAKYHGFHTDIKPRAMQINWDKELLAVCDPAGSVESFRFSGLQTAEEKVVADVCAWLENKQDDRIEQVALALERDPLGFAGGLPTVTKYALFHKFLTTGYQLRFPGAIDPHFESWIERQAKSRLARYCQAEKLRKEAWKARGSGFANAVTEEQWKVFHDKLAEVEVIIDSFAKEKTILPIMYPLIFEVAKGQQWDEEKIKPFLDRMLKECPDNLAAHTAHAESLMPRWGGEVDDCREYAERVAQHLGGPAGDAVYAVIAHNLHQFHAQGVFEELGFDSDRVQSGLKHLYRDSLNSPVYRETAMVMAVLARDRAKAVEMKLEVVKHNDAWVPGVALEPLYDRIMKLLSTE